MTMTKITQAAFQGKTAERDMTDNRRLNPCKKNRANNTEPARTRPGATYPGGKAMRKSLARLEMRRKMHGVTGIGTPHTMPGSRSK